MSKIKICRIRSFLFYVSFINKQLKFIFRPASAAKSSAIKTGELTLNSTLLEFFLLMLLSFKRKRFMC